MRVVDTNYFIKMIANKRVALIGPAEYVCKELGEEHGKFIDNFDIVIKMNGMIHLPNAELEKYYGKKLDILVSSFWYTHDVDYELNKKISGDKYYKCEKYINPEYYKNLKENVLLFENVPRNLFNKIYSKHRNVFDSKTNLKYCCISDKFSQNSNNYLNNLYNLNNGITTGMIAIANILLSNPKELYISGLTFYKDMKHKAYYDNYHERLETGKNNNDYYKNTFLQGKLISESVQLMSGHNILGEQSIFKTLIDNKKITVDKYLLSLYN